MTSNYLHRSKGWSAPPQRTTAPSRLWQVAQFRIQTRLVQFLTVMVRITNWGLTKSSYSRIKIVVTPRFAPQQPKIISTHRPVAHRKRTVIWIKIMQRNYRKTSSSSISSSPFQMTNQVKRLRNKKESSLETHYRPMWWIWTTFSSLWTTWMIQYRRRRDSWVKANSISIQTAVIRDTRRSGHPSSKVRISSWIMARSFVLCRNSNSKRTWFHKILLTETTIRKSAGLSVDKVCSATALKRPVTPTTRIASVTRTSVPPATN